MGVIRPSVGRVVLFRQMTPGVFPGSEDVRAAIVAHVHSDRMVNLLVIDANGGTHARTSVQFVQPGDPVPTTAHCHWMEYQLGQAARTEAAEKQLAGR